MSCIFCKIALRELPADVIYETESILAFKDIAPVAPVHVIVIPKKHLRSVLDLSPEEGMLTTALIQAVREIAISLNLPENGFRVVTNVGSDGGQTVNHIHLHLLAGRPLSWPPG